MNDVILIVLAEIVLILALLLLTVLYVGWKRKKNNNKALEQLLDAVTKQEDARKSALVDYLLRHQKMDNRAALELCEDFVEAEKQFMYLFLEQQMKQTSVSGFYEQLCELLDKYLNLLPVIAGSAAKNPPTELNPTNLKPSASKATPEPDWESAFAEVVNQEFDDGKKNGRE